MKILKKSKLGFTLIELMIGLILAYIIADGALSILTNSISTDEYQKSILNLQNETDFAMDYLSSDIKLSSFSQESNINSLSKQPFNWSQTIDGKNLANDQIGIFYDNISNNTDCDGNSNKSQIANHYYVAEELLMCNNQILLEGVKSFQLLYGIDFNNDNRIDRYVKAKKAQELSLKSSFKIIAVKVDLLAGTKKEYTSNYIKKFYLLGESPLSFNDGKIYRKYSRTIILKNML